MSDQEKNNPDTDAAPSEPTDDVQPSAGTTTEHDQQADSPSPQDQNDHTLDHILHLEVPLIVKVAQKKMRMRELLKFNLGTIIQFEKDAYDHIDLMVNNSTIGLGQPVKIGENFGIRLVQVGNIEETIRSLGRKKRE